MTGRRIAPSGPVPCELLVVGEAPGVDEELQGAPFIGISGRLLRALCHNAGIDLNNARITNVCPYRPPGNKIEEWLTKGKKKAKEAGLTEFRAGRYIGPKIVEGLELLKQEVLEGRPRVVMAVGSTALWALTGHTEITSWRGSELWCDLWGHECLVIPVYHPAGVLRMWSWKPTLQHDLRARVARDLREGYAEPDFDFTTEPTLNQVVTFLRSVREGDWLAVDTETRQKKVIDCVGFATSPLRAICVPIITGDYRPYWDTADAKVVMQEMEEALKRARVVMQNGNYDRQYFKRCFGWEVRRDFDTMTAQHVLYPGTPKPLDYLASLYCDRYRFWKDDAKDLTPEMEKNDHMRWEYNCTDCCRTFEVMLGQQEGLREAGLETQFQEQLESGDAALHAMNRGVRLNNALRKQLDGELTAAINVREEKLAEMLGHPYNPRSYKQTGELFDQMQLPKPRVRKENGAMGDTFAAEYLEEVMERYPEHASWLGSISEIRSMGVLRSNFVRAPLDTDGRFRSSLNVDGPETFRLSSSENAFGTGCNIQNITDGSKSPTGLKMPNLRRAIIPDTGMLICEADLERADLQVVAKITHDDLLMQRLQAHAEIHLENACDLYGLPGIDHVTDAQKRLAKVFCHATDYYAKPRTISRKCGVTVHEAERLQKRWFDIHPGIPEWHKRVRAALEATRCVTNAFGYRRIYFDRIDDRIVAQALAWEPQSTVALVINHGWKRIVRELPEIWVLFQVHDSLIFQVPEERAEELLALARPRFLVEIPYADGPLVIGIELKTSNVSWGDCSKRAWPVLAASQD